jgi:Glycosyl transferases group 1
LFPVDWPEPFGLVMIEAMACGTPVLAFRCGSIPEVIEDGVTGKVVGSEAEAIAVLPAILAYDRRAVRQRFEDRFISTRMAKDYVSTYRRLLKTRTSGARAIYEREYFFAVVVFIDLVDLGGDFQRDASGARYSNRAVWTLFRRNPPQEGKVAPRLKRRLVQIGRNAVVNCRDKIGVRQWLALVVGDRNHWHFAEAGIEGF